MLKYYEYLLKIKSFVKRELSLEIFNNLDKFPINTNPDLKEYYEKIAEKIEFHRKKRTQPRGNDKFYIRKIKPIFINRKIYYEVTFSHVNDRVSKFDRMIAFTDRDISPYYATKLRFIDEKIEVFGKAMPIFIIAEYEVSIRPSEFENFAKILGVRLKNASNYAEYRELMIYLTQTGRNLTELLDLSDTQYEVEKDEILNNAKATTSHIFDLLDRCRYICKHELNGCNVLRYLLYRLNNKIIKLQLDEECDKWNSEMRINTKCWPFDQMPFVSSLRGHNPKLSDLLDCLDAENREYELFARFIKNNIEIKGKLYTSLDECISKFDDPLELLNKYNQKLWERHKFRSLIARDGYIYIREYEDDTIVIINRLKELTGSGIPNYSSSVKSWLQTGTYVIDSEEKEKILEEMFANSTVALIYGAAGTGKSTIINHLSHFFSANKKLYLAQTNPAINNLKKRITAANSEFSTITKFLVNENVNTDYDLLIIDECSTVNNKVMRAILKKATFKLLVLVGDVYQIESIRFGNWFNAVRSFIPKTSIFELTKPYRSQSEDLCLFWNKVRTMDELLLEHIVRNGYSITLDKSIFSSAEKDGIILCLNYDGLYGINNINRFLQESNKKPAIHWGEQIYKVNDPILFNESEWFAPLIFNNMKGRIVGVRILKETNQIQFDIELDTAINGMDAQTYGLILLENSQNDNSVIRFEVDRLRSSDEDSDSSMLDVTPFQVAYAVSIHKAQGLEYDSVKIVITDEIDELITHNIFYTAITRAMNKLQIYWAPEVEQKILSSIKPRDNSDDIKLLRSSME